MNIIKDWSFTNIEYDLYDQGLYEINKQSKASTPEWLSEQVNNGSISEKNKEELLNMIGLLETICGELWDIQIFMIRYHFNINQVNTTGYGLPTFMEYREINKLCFRIILKFPEITITNSSKLSHIIRDLYVGVNYIQGMDIDNVRINRDEVDSEDDPDLERGNGFWVPCQDFRITGLDGKRGILTTTEYSKSYIHSHLPGESQYKPDHWSPFCRGTGEINHTLLMLGEEYSPDMFTLLLYQIDAFVRWESVEGRPHQYIKGLINGEGSITIPTINTTYLQRYITNLKQQRRIEFENFPEREDIKINWKLEEGRFQVIEDDNFDNFVKRNQSIDRYPWSDNVVYQQDREGLYYNPANIGNMEESIPYYDKEEYILFRKQNIALQVIKVNEKTELNPGFIIHPNIKKHIKEKLEAYVNYNEIRANISKRANQINNS